MTEQNDHEISQEAERVYLARALERQGTETRIYEINLGHYEKLAVLQAGILALSVTFLAGLGSEALAHHKSVRQLGFLITCWIALLFSVGFCVIRNWMGTKSFNALNSAWGWQSMKSTLKHITRIPSPNATLALTTELNRAGILDKWQGEATRRFIRLNRVITTLEYAVHALFLMSLLCLVTFAIMNAGVFVR